MPTLFYSFIKNPILYILYFPFRLIILLVTLIIYTVLALGFSYKILFKSFDLNQIASESRIK